MTSQLCQILKRQVKALSSSAPQALALMQLSISKCPTFLIQPWSRVQIPVILRYITSQQSDFRFAIESFCIESRKTDLLFRLKLRQSLKEEKGGPEPE